MLALLTGACGHGAGGVRDGAAVPWIERDEPEEGVRVKGNSVVARIHALIAQGQLAEAEVLIAESSAAGLLSKPQATRLLESIAKLNTKLGEVPARLQRAKDFPSQLKDYTLYQIQKMLDDGDFSLATKAQLKEAAKLIKEQSRLMEKL
ncbi:hypothetical protein [Archangium sp.]|jgi:hypothetical protein|uniref:hypothetical protein n=1 Tax=Archangium sp. TaxID=1872627 RepID=UPI002ED83AE6